MSANTTPIFPLTPKIGFGKVINADTSYEAPTTSGVLVFTAGVNGSRIDQIRARALGTNAATVLRIFINDGLGPGVSNFALVYEKSLTASTASASAETGTDIDLLVEKSPGEKHCPIEVLPPGYKIYASVGTTVASGYMVSVHGGDF